MKLNNTIIIIGIVALLLFTSQQKKEWGTPNAWPDTTTCTFITNVDPASSPYTSYGNSGAWILIDADNDGTKEAYGYISSGGVGSTKPIIVNDYYSTSDIRYDSTSQRIHVSSSSGYKSFELNYGAAVDAVDICGGGCTDTCTGAPTCSGNYVISCQDTNSDGCLEPFSSLCSSGCIVENGQGHCVTAVVCSSNSQCGTDGWEGTATCTSGDVYQNYRTWTCNSPGTTSSSCSSTLVSTLKEDCGTASCSNGVCVGTECTPGDRRCVVGYTDRYNLCLANGQWGGATYCGGTLSCYLGQCCTLVNGVWSSYGSWSTCTRTSGCSGTQTQSRSCTNPAPSCGGATCSGSATNSQSCTITPRNVADTDCSNKIDWTEINTYLGEWLAARATWIEINNAIGIWLAGGY